MHEAGKSEQTIVPEAVYSGLRARVPQDVGDVEPGSRGLARQRSDSPGEARETISAEPLTPELVLVDPDLARRAREQLPDREPEPRRTTGESIPSPVTSLVDPDLARRGREKPPAREPEPRRTTVVAIPYPVTPRLVVVQPDPSTFERRLKPPPRKRRRGRILVLLTLAAAAVAGIVLVPSLRHIFWESREVAVVQPVREPAPPPHPSSSTPDKAKPNETVKPKARVAPRSAPSHRPFAWVAVPKATYYLVRFYRGSQEIFEARPSAPRLSLPPEWVFKGHRYSLTPGTYRWVVQAGFGRPTEARLGQPIVSAQLVV
jgi:hypothetical protein